MAEANGSDMGAYGRTTRAAPRGLEAAGPRAATRDWGVRCARRGTHVPARRARPSLPSGLRPCAKNNHNNYED